jgi:hypothetical protein
MDTQDLRNLQEAYMEVVMNEGLGGAKDPNRQESRDKEDEEIRRTFIERLKKRETPEQRQETADEAEEFLRKHPRRRRTQKEQADLYDIILSHLLDEGYADCLGSAEIILENMSEEWLEDIIEEKKPISIRQAKAMSKRAR